MRAVPGFYEGQLQFTKARFNSTETQRVLSRSDWVPAGMASFVRAIDLIDAIKGKHGGQFSHAFEVLATAS
jgi:hypothetical protein